jgi:outer membrane protein assembly factor BamB
LFSVETPGQEHLIWKTPIGGRSSPLILGDRLYMITAAGEGITEGERVVCLDANTGKPIWEHRFNVFHTDIVSSRLGWTTLTADPEAGYIYCHGTQGHVFCFDRDGQIIWQRNLTEEYGRVTGYGGRIVSPIFDSGLVIVGMVNSSWGDQARGNNRFVAFDGKTGEVVWWSSPGDELIQTQPSYRLLGTYYSNPVVAVINGQRLLITGGADGYAHAFKVRTGERVWSYRFSAGVVNPSPVVDGNLVYLAHGEENPEGGPLGRIICLDASQVTNKTPKLVWEFRRSNRFGLASPAIADGILYVPDDSSELFAFDAKKGGRPLWRYKYGTTARGAPLIADGKLYVFDVFAKLTVLELNGRDEPDVLEETVFRNPGSPILIETNGTPIAVNGRLYFMTREATYCVGDEAAKSQDAPLKKEPPETPYDPNAKPAAIRVFPADVTTKPGGETKLEVKVLDANGREVNAPADAKVEWSLPTPPPPPGARSGPPPLRGEVQANGVAAAVKVDQTSSQQGVVLAKVGNLTARARVRSVAQLPYFNDFEKLPDGGAPGGWVNTNGKFVIKTLDGNKVLSKVNTSPAPPLARANGYITLPSATNYVIECDVMGTDVRGIIPDIGLVNSRYTLLLDGKKDPDTGRRSLRLVSWEARPPTGRVNVGKEYDWTPDTWYTLKLAVEQKENSAVIRGKVWKKGESEPETWSIEFEDPAPNREGAAAVYAYISNVTDTDPGSDAYFDNLKITPATNTK